MPVNSVPFDVKDLQLAVFAAGTYGTFIDVPGIQSLEITPNMDSDDLWGDSQSLGSIIKSRSTDGKYTTQFFNPTAEAATSGGAILNDGTGTTARTRYVATDELSAVPYVGLRGLIGDAGDGVGATIASMPKVRVTSPAPFTASRDTPTFDRDLKISSNENRKPYWLDFYVDSTTTIGATVDFNDALVP